MVVDIWAFVYAKQKHVEFAKAPPRGAGDAWTCTAICADTKLLVSWMVGDRSAETAVPRMEDLTSRLRHRVQLTTDGHRAYLQAVRQVFGRDIDYAMLITILRERDRREHREAVQSGDVQRDGACGGGGIS